MLTSATVNLLQLPSHPAPLTSSADNQVQDTKLQRRHSVHCKMLSAGHLALQPPPRALVTSEGRAMGASVSLMVPTRPQRSSVCLTFATRLQSVMVLGDTTALLSPTS